MTRENQISQKRALQTVPFWSLLYSCVLEIRAIFEMANVSEDGICLLKTLYNRSMARASWVHTVQDTTPTHDSKGHLGLRTAILDLLRPKGTEAQGKPWLGWGGGV